METTVEIADGSQDPRFDPSSSKFDLKGFFHKEAGDRKFKGYVGSEEKIPHIELNKASSSEF